MTNDHLISAQLAFGLSAVICFIAAIAIPHHSGLFILVGWVANLITWSLVGYQAYRKRR